MISFSIFNIIVGRSCEGSALSSKDSAKEVHTVSIIGNRKIGANKRFELEEYSHMQQPTWLPYNFNRK